MCAHWPNIAQRDLIVVVVIVVVIVVVLAVICRAFGNFNFCLGQTDKQTDTRRCL